MKSPILSLICDLYVVFLMFEMIESVSLQLSDCKNKEEQLKQEMAEKEEKRKKVILAAKLKINQVNSKLDQLHLALMFFF